MLYHLAIDFACPILRCKVSSKLAARCLERFFSVIDPPCFGGGGA